MTAAFRDGIPQTTFIAAGAQTVIKKGPGTLISFSITTAGAAGTINDAATVGAVAITNQMFTTPAAIEAVYCPFTFQNGLIITPGAGQTIAICWQ